MKTIILTLMLAASSAAQTGPITAGTWGKAARDQINKNAVMKNADGSVTVGTTVLEKAGTVYNVKAWGALGNERTVTDAACTATSSTCTSVTGAFTSADTGKTVTVAAGPQGLRLLQYVSGGSITGTTGQYCTLATFNGGGSGATGIVNLTGTNAIVGSPGVTLTNNGTGYTGNATTATLGSGTATCSGTAVITTTGFYPRPITATATFVNATTITLSTTATTTVTGAILNIGTDDSVAILAAITAANTAGGGTVYFPVGKYLMLSQMLFPNDGATLPVQSALRLQGDGSLWDGSWTCRNGAGIGTCAANNAATVLDLRYAGTVAKIDTRGRGHLRLEDISFEDWGDDTLPFLQTTNTTLYVHNTSWVGSGMGVAASQQDAIILGGGNTPNSWGGLSTSAFQGYGTQIDHNYFSKMSRGIYAKVWVNDINISYNVWSNTCGGLTAMEIDGTGDESLGNTWIGNLFEMSGYSYAVTFRNAKLNPGFGNTLWDNAGLFIAGVRLAGTAGLSSGNTCDACGMFGVGFVDDAGSNTWRYSNGNLVSGSAVAAAGPTFSSLTTASGDIRSFGNVIAGTGSQFLGAAGSGSKLYGDANGSWVMWNNAQNDFTLLKLGGTGAGFPGLKRFGNALAGRLATDAVPVFSTLTTCAAAGEGAFTPVSDSTTGTYGVTITGGGSTHVLAYCNGTNWTVH